MITQRGRTVFTLYLYLMMLLYGASAVMIGTILPVLLDDFSLSLGLGGFVVTVQSIGGLIALFIGFSLADRLRKRTVTIVSFLSLGLIWVCTALSNSYLQLTVFFFLSGMAIRILDLTMNAVVGDLYPTRRGLYMNLLHMFFGVGACIGPIGARLLLDSGLSWRSVYYLVGSICVLLSFPGLISLRRREEPAAVRPGAIAARLKDPRILLLSLSLLFYIMHQSGMTSWLPTYMGRVLGAGAVLSSLSLSLFWVGIISGRLAASLLADRFGAARLGAAGGLIGGIVLTVGLLSDDPAAVIAASLLAGCLTGATIPLAMVIAHDCYPANTGSLTALLSIFMLSGRVVSPYLIGVVSDTAGMRTGMQLSGVTLFISGVLSVSAAIMVRRRPTSNSGV